MSYNIDNQNISFESSDLIEELKKDIEEFGNIEMYCFFKEINGIKFVTNYDFIDDETDLESQKILKDEIVFVMKAEEILKLLEKQNEVL